MSDYNHVVIIGRLGGDPEIFRNRSKLPFAKVQIATNKRWKKDGIKQSRTDWHSVIFPSNLCDLAEQYLHKGDKVMIAGELASDKWHDKNGNKRFSVFVRAKELRFLTPKEAHVDTAVIDSSAEIEDINIPHAE